MSTIEFPWVDEQIPAGIGRSSVAVLVQFAHFCWWVKDPENVSFSVYYTGIVTGLEHMQSSLCLRVQSGKGNRQEIQCKEQRGKRKEPETNDRVFIYSVEVITGQLRWFLKP
jgi:hypothetical protein